MALERLVVFAAFIVSVSAACEPDSRRRSLLLSSDERRYQFAFFNKTLIADCGCSGEFTCIRKCCDESYVLEEECIRNTSVQMALPVFRYRNVIIDDDVSISKRRYVSGVPECLIDEIDDDDDDFYTADADEFFLQSDGRLWLPALNTFFEMEHFCIDATKDDYAPQAILCILQYDTQALDISNRITVVGMIISIPFLILTFVTYAILPLRNLHGKALMCYVFSLCVAYLITVVTELQEEPIYNAITCKAISMLFYFFFEASFMWMNVMCIDIFLSFRGTRSFDFNKTRLERRRFVIYSVYAWSVPAILVVIVQTFSVVFKPNRWYNPGVSDQECWLNDGIPLFVYFYLPMTIVIIVNITLFAITACRILRVRRDAAGLRKSRDDTMRFGIYLKLFLAMGANWSMEIVSWAINWRFEKVPPAVWYFTDFCNAAFGVVIFVIFVCNRKVWKLVKQRWKNIREKPSSNLNSSELSTMRET